MPIEALNLCLTKIAFKLVSFLLRRQYRYGNSFFTTSVYCVYLCLHQPLNQILIFFESESMTVLDRADRKFLSLP